MHGGGILCNDIQTCWRSTGWTAAASYDLVDYFWESASGSIPSRRRHKISMSRIQIGDDGRRILKRSTPKVTAWRIIVVINNVVFYYAVRIIASWGIPCDSEASDSGCNADIRRTWGGLRIGNDANNARPSPKLVGSAIGTYLTSG